jgi:hypothetical protein
MSHRGTAFNSIQCFCPALLFTTALLVSAWFFAGCATQHAGTVTARSHRARSTSGTDGSAVRLSAELAALSSAVSRQEADLVARRAYAVSAKLARDYRVIGPPLFHNFLVNSGIRQRGLCFQWTEDLMRELHAMRLKTVELHWATARGGTLREHNSVVVTARGQPFTEGVVLDAWRHSGRLFWGRLAADHYPWRQDDRWRDARLQHALLGERLQSDRQPDATSRYRRSSAR